MVAPNFTQVKNQKLFRWPYTEHHRPNPKLFSLDWWSIKQLDKHLMFLWVFLMSKPQIRVVLWRLIKMVVSLRHFSINHANCCNLQETYLRNIGIRKLRISMCTACDNILLFWLRTDDENLELYDYIHKYL